MLLSIRLFRSSIVPNSIKDLFREKEVRNDREGEMRRFKIPPIWRNVKLIMHTKGEREGNV